GHALPFGVPAGVGGAVRAGAIAAVGVLLAFAAGSALLPGRGALVVAAGQVCVGGLGVLEQEAEGWQRAVLLDQLGDPGPGPAQPEADLGVGEALPCPPAGLPQPGGAEDRRGGPPAGPPPPAPRPGGGGGTPAPPR